MDHSPDPETGFWRDISTSYGQISMKFNWSIAAEAWTNWLHFELDPDHSPDPGTGFLNFSGISQEVMDRSR